MSLKSMVWKELRDLSRDKKTIMSAILLPALMLPLMAQLLVLAQRSTPIQVVVINEDRGVEVPGLLLQPGLLPLLENSTVQKVNLGKEIIKILEESVKKAVPNTRFVVINGVPKEVPPYDVLVLIPSDFSEKLLALDPAEFNTTEVQVFYRAKSSSLGISGTQVYQIIVSTFNFLSKQYFAKQRVSILLACCNVTNVGPEAVLSPIIVKTQYVSATGKTISARELGKMLSAKMLLLSIFYVSAPILAFISDTIAGEKERKTLETLLASPISRRDIVVGKFVASLTLGALAAMADIVGMIFYIEILNSMNAQLVSAVASNNAQTMTALSLTFDPSIVALHGLVMLLVVASSAALLMPIVSLTDSVRSAQSVGGFVLMLPLLIVLYAIYSSIEALPLTAKLLVFLIPHTYAIMAIDYALKGNWLGTAESVLAIIAITIALLFVTIKIFESEILITGSRILRRSKTSS